MHCEALTDEHTALNSCTARLYSKRAAISEMNGNFTRRKQAESDSQRALRRALFWFVRVCRRENVTEFKFRR